MTQASRFRPRPALKAVAVGVILGVGGCGSGQPADDPVPTTGTGTQPITTISIAPSVPAEPTFDATGLDLCSRTDRAPLGSLSLIVERTDPAPPRSGSGSACLFDLRPPGGEPASLRVEAVTLTSAEEAGRLYRATEHVSTMTADGNLAGVGEQARAFTKQSAPGFKYAEYLIHARHGNLVVKVWLAVGGKAFTAKDDLAAVTLALTKSTLAGVPKA